MNSLNYDKLFVPFVGGLDTKSDQKTVVPTKLTVLENAEFVERGSVKKRQGYDSIATETVDGTDFDGDTKGLFAHRDTAVVVTDQKAYGLADSSRGWLELGTFSTMSYTQTPVVQNSAEQVYGESAVANNVRVTVWEDSRGGVRMSVHDAVTGAPYTEDFSLDSADAARPKVVAIGGTLLVTWVDTASDNILYFRVLTWDVETSLAGSSATLVSDLSTSTNVYDIVSVGDNAVLVYDSDNVVVNGVRACLVNSGGSTSNFKQVTSSNASTNVAAIYDADENAVFFFFRYSATNYFVGKHNASDLVNVITTLHGDVTVASRVGFCKSPSGYTAWVETDPSTDDLRTVRATPFTAGLSAGSVTTVRHAFIASNGFYDGSGFVVLGHDSRTGLQDGYYLFNHEAKMVGQLLVGQGVGVVDSKDHLPSVRPGASSSQHLLPLGFKRQVDVDGDDIATYEHKGIMLVTFDSDTELSGEQVGDTLYVGGAQVWAINHGQPVEAGFTMFPDVQLSDISHDGNASSNIASGEVRSYRIYYEWRLSNGERFRSAAITRSFTATAAESIQIAVPTLSFTLKDGDINDVTDVAIVGYKTEANKSDIYHRFTDVDPTATGENGYYANDVTADSVTLVDDLSDSDLISNEIDYQSKGEVRHFSAPPGTTLKAVGNRLFVGGGSLEEDQVAYSLLHTPGRPVEFSGFLDHSLSGRGAVRGIHTINGAPVLFKERSIYALEGQGPDNTNRDGGYYLARKLTSDVGLSDPGVVVETPQGLIFKSHKGFYLLDQSLNVSYIGAEAEAYNDQTFTAATVIPDSNTVVFLAESGSTLIYDYFYGQWGVWTNHAGVAAVVLAGGTYCYLRGDGKLYKRSSEYTDAGVPYSMRIRTAPIRPEFLQGHWKVLAFQVLGDYRSLHKLKVSLLYNRDGASSETYTWDPSTVISTDTWGDGATWGSGSYWGGAAGGNEYQHEHRPKRSKCQTIRFEFEDIPGTNPGASYELTELAILYRDWGGLSRLPAARKY